MAGRKFGMWEGWGEIHSQLPEESLILYNRDVTHTKNYLSVATQAIYSIRRFITKKNENAIDENSSDADVFSGFVNKPTVLYQNTNNHKSKCGCVQWQENH
jgi:hypothetical protein